MSSEKAPLGRIVTFYSFKGGTGRSMALANVAWILASNGYKVLAVDWDLEAPGLHRYFHPFLVDQELRGTPGLMDLLWDFATAAMDTSGDTGPDWYVSYADVLTYAVSLRHDFGKRATLDLLPAGKQNLAYGPRVGTFDWANFYDRLGGGLFVEALKKSMRAEYDYVLVDSRTGLSDTSGICTVQLPDTLVACFTLNTQSIAGAAEVADEVGRQRAADPPRILPLLMRVDDSGDPAKAELGRDYAQSRFSHHLTGMSQDQRQRYWGDVEIPYRSFYAYEEILATIGDRPHEPGSVMAACERLTRHLTDGAVAELVPLDETERRRLLAQFERARLPRDDHSYYISAASEDRRWAEWIANVIEDTGCTVYRPWDLPPGSNWVLELQRALSRASHVVAVLSDDYFANEFAATEWQSAFRTDPRGSFRRLLPVRVAPCDVPPLLQAIRSVDLVGLDERRATQLLVDATSGGRYSPRTQRVRFPGAPPAVWKVPPRPKNFVGRSDELWVLTERLRIADRSAVVAVVGMPGVGKTSLAIEYAHRSVARYDAVWWIDADGPAAGVEVQLRSLLNLLETEVVEPANTLVVLDGASAPATLPRLPTDIGDILVTSQYRDWAAAADLVTLEPLPAAYATELIMQRMPDVSTVDASRLAELCGDLPFWIVAVANYLRQTSLPVGRYLDQLEKAPSSTLPSVDVGPFARVVAELRRSSPEAGNLLEVLAFFAPEPVPISLLATGRDLYEVEAAADHLVRVSLAQRDLADVFVHPVVQAVVSGGLSPEQSAIRRNQVESLLVDALPGSPRNQANWPGWARLLPHLLRAIGGASPKAVYARDQVCRYLFVMGEWRHCAALAEDVAMRATVSGALGHYLDAEILFRHLLKDETAHHGASHPAALEARYGQAICLHALGSHELALQANDQLLVTWRRVKGNDAPETLGTMGNLVNNLRAVGRLDVAFTTAKELATRTRRPIDTDPLLAIGATMSLASVEYSRGAYTVAQRLLREAYQVSLEVFGQRHPTTLDALHDLAAATARRDGIDEARGHAESAFDLRRQVLGDDHPDTLWSLYNLTILLTRRGEHEPARNLLEAVRIPTVMQSTVHSELIRIQDPDLAFAAEEWVGHHAFHLV